MKKKQDTPSDKVKRSASISTYHSTRANTELGTISEKSEICTLKIPRKSTYHEKARHETDRPLKIKTHKPKNKADDLSSLLSNLKKAILERDSMNIIQAMSKAKQWGLPSTNTDMTYAQIVLEELQNEEKYEAYSSDYHININTM